MGSSCSTILGKVNKNGDVIDGKGKESKKKKKGKGDKKEQEKEVGPKFKSDFTKKGFKLDEVLISILKKRFTNTKKKTPKKERSQSTSGGKKRVDRKFVDSKERYYETVDVETLSPEEKKRIKVLKLFEKIDKWDVNFFEISKETDNHPLVYVGYILLLKYECIKNFNIDEKKLIHFLVQVELTYWNNNPFYNSTRAASILQAFCYLLRKGLCNYLCDEDIFVGILSCIIIYLDRPYLDNGYQRQTESFVSTIYNDNASLENNSLRQFYELIGNSSINILDGLNDEQKKYVRQQLIDVVLAVDDACLSKTIKLTHKSIQASSDFSSKEDVKLLLQMSLIFSNFAFTFRTRRHFIRWIQHYLLQHYVQGKIEEIKGLEINEYGISKDIERKLVKLLETKVKPVTKIMISILSSIKFVGSFLKKNKSLLQIPDKEYSMFKEDIDEEIKQFTKIDGIAQLQEPIRIQNLFIKKLKAIYGFPEDRKLNVPMNIQKQRTPIVTPIYKDLEKDCMGFLRKRWDINNSKNREELSREAKIYALVDFERYSECKSRPSVSSSDQINSSSKDELEIKIEEVEKKVEPVKDELDEDLEIDSIGKPEEVEKQVEVIEVKDKEELSYEDTKYSVIAMFERIDDYNFDVFALTKLLGNDAMYLTGYVLFVKYDLIRRFKIDEQILLKFLRKVTLGYQRNDYHNAMHGCDVMQVTNSIIKKGGMFKKMNHIDIIAAIVGSMVHDLDHPGFNDAFQVHSYSYLAKLYNDRSVLEAHHCSSTFRIMREENLDIFAGMTREERQDARRTMADMIIATDMSNHAKYVKDFNELIEKDSDFTDKKDIRIALQIVIKIADVSNPSRPLYLYLQWTDYIIKEFYRQGDAEKLYELPISPLMDRETSVLSKGQIAFAEYVLVPMFQSFASIFKDSEFLVTNTKENMKYWSENETIKKAFIAPQTRKTVREISHGVVNSNLTLHEDLYIPQPVEKKEADKEKSNEKPTGQAVDKV